MGISTGGICYETQALANDAFYSSQGVAMSGLDATQAVFVSFFKSGTIWNKYIEVYDVVNGYPVVSNTVPQSNVGTACTYSDAADITGADIAVLLSAALGIFAAAWGFKMIGRLLFKDA